jgi:exopolysaccharide biosynthesis polyprenyl glycosylphosphotransferase
MHTIAPLAVSDSVPPPSPRKRIHSPSTRRHALLLRGAGIVACFDSVAAVGANLAALIALSRPQISIDDVGVLSAPITVSELLILVFVAAAWPMVFSVFGLYEARRVLKPSSEAARLVAATAAGSVLALAFSLTTIPLALAVWNLPRFWLASLALCLLVRAGRRLVEHAREREPRRALIVGTGPLARAAYKDVRLRRSPRYKVVGFVDELAESIPPQPPLWGTLDQLEPLLMREELDEVVIALPVKSCYQQMQRVISVCERVGVQAKYAADLFETTVASPRYDLDGHRAFVTMQVAPDGYTLAIKRGIDIVGAAVGLVVLSPLLLVTAAAIKLTSPGPIVFAQERCGLARRPFRMYKFRSMYAGADKLQESLEERNEASGPVFKIRDDPRVTPLGRFLRKTSVDELPQLWNVLCGNMSLVGPRPLPWRDVRHITRASDMRRCSMRPGMTCLWQIQGRNNIGFERWVELDLEYIDTWSLALDAWILVKTIPAVLSGNGAA